MGAQVCTPRGTFGPCECSGALGGSEGRGGSGTGGVSQGGNSTRGGTSGTSAGGAGRGGSSGGGTSGAGSGGEAGEGPVAPDSFLTLPGKITRVVYDTERHVVHGIDPANRRLATFDLSLGTARSQDVIQIPNDLCVDAERNRLFVVNSGSTLVSEHDRDTLAFVREIDWGAPAASSSYDDTHFHIHCAKERLYLVDATSSPGLWSVEDLEGSPTAVDHSDDVSGVGDLVLAADQASFYYWQQIGWNAGNVGTTVKRWAVPGFMLIDEANLGYQDEFFRDPLDTPILLDPMRSLILAKNRVFDATNLARVIFTFTSPEDDSRDGAIENAYAIDPLRGRFATAHHVFSLDDFTSILSIERGDSGQMFFDRDGQLYVVLTNEGVLGRWQIPP
jgi:hypothetical protein